MSSEVLRSPTGEVERRRKGENIMPSLRCVSGIPRVTLPNLFKRVGADRFGNKVSGEGLACLGGGTAARVFDVRFDQPLLQTATVIVSNGEKPVLVRSHINKEDEPTLPLLATLTSFVGGFKMNVGQTSAGLFVDFPNDYPLAFSAVLDGGSLNAQARYNLAAIYQGYFAPGLSLGGDVLGIILQISDHLKATPYAVAAAATEGTLGIVSEPCDLAFFWSSEPERGAANLQAHFDYMHKRLAPGKTVVQDARCGFFGNFNAQVLEKQLSAGAWIDGDVELIEINP